MTIYVLDRRTNNVDVFPGAASIRDWAAECARRDGRDCTINRRTPIAIALRAAHPDICTPAGVLPRYVRVRCHDVRKTEKEA